MNRAFNFDLGRIDRPNEGLGSIQDKPTAGTNSTLLSSVAIRYVALEFLVIVFFSYGATELYRALVLGDLMDRPLYFVSSVVIGCVFVFLDGSSGGYSNLRRKPLHAFLWSGLVATMISASILLAILFCLKLSDTYSRVSFMLQIVSIAGAVCISRLMFRSWLVSAIHAGKIDSRRVLLIGPWKESKEVSDRLGQSGIRTQDWISLTPGNAAQAERSLHCAAEFDRLVKHAIERCRSSTAHDVLIVTRNKDLQIVSKFVNALSEVPVAVHIVLTDAPSIIASSRIADFGPIQTFEVHGRPLSQLESFLKRTLDLFVALAALTILSPLLLIVAIAIKLGSPGPILFRQKRHGFNNEPIYVLKFRTMTVCHDTVFKQATKNDPRVTRVGRALRQSSIDELPQLINVLKGEMSIVGPRPHAVEHNALLEQHIPLFSRRHKVKPGITGWAQINGYRGETDTVEKMRKRFEYDLYYVENWSLLLDIKIIAMTLFSKKAYLNAY